MGYLSQNSHLILFLVACVAATVIPRFLPLFCLRGEIPHWLREWLDYIPAAVMAALVAPDLLFINGTFTPDPTQNIFLIAGVLTLAFCALTKNFFGTILFGMGIVALMRYFGF